jgi:hypothetical protein
VINPPVACNDAREASQEIRHELQALAGKSVRGPLPAPPPARGRGAAARGAPWLGGLGQGAGRGGAWGGPLGPTPALAVRRPRAASVAPTMCRPRTPPTPALGPARPPAPQTSKQRSFRDHHWDIFGLDSADDVHPGATGVGALEAGRGAAMGEEPGSWERGVM